MCHFNFYRNNIGNKIDFIKKICDLLNHFIFSFGLLKKIRIFTS